MFHPDDIDGHARTDSVALKALVFIGHPATARKKVIHLDPVDAALAMLPITNLIQRMDVGDLLSRVAPIVNGVPAFGLSRAPLPQMAAAVRQVLREECK
jgi:hypothetical protein